MKLPGELPNGFACLGVVIVVLFGVLIVVYLVGGDELIDLLGVHHSYKYNILR